ncbi:hypothetical protein AB0J01_37795 [Streptomyces sp. NPDC050204]|uniref:hypothetical protein n=1 Tax=Streptomyces sp. NPDC050204 TaxID=3155514 RepID=UPI00341884C0
MPAFTALPARPPGPHRADPQIGLVAGALRQAGHREAASEFARDAVRSTSYDNLLQLIMCTVDTQ